MIAESEWASIRTVVERVVKSMIGTRADYFVTGKVIRRDEQRKLIWMKEFGDQAIPLVAFDYEISYYDETPQGTTYGSAGANATFKTTKKVAKAQVQVPKIGESVLVAKELGTSRLPRCLGVIKGKGWIVPEEE